MTWHLTSREEREDIGEKKWIIQFPIEIKRLKEINKSQKEKIQELGKSLHDAQIRISEYRKELNTIINNIPHE